MEVPKSLPSPPHFQLEGGGARGGPGACLQQIAGLVPSPGGSGGPEGPEGPWSAWRARHDVYLKSEAKTILLRG